MSLQIARKSEAKKEAQNLQCHFLYRLHSFLRFVMTDVFIRPLRDRICGPLSDVIIGHVHAFLCLLSCMCNLIVVLPSYFVFPLLLAFVILVTFVPSNLSVYECVQAQKVYFCK
uniref:Uncharacterized protein n=1 Tax=Lotus japonicus TaxID=34305 RepID=I3TAK3_LOTJA|nr:unknown [Lotus japonicus]